MRKILLMIVCVLVFTTVASGQRENPRRLSRDQQREINYHERTARRHADKVQKKEKKQRYYREEARKAAELRSYTRQRTYEEKAKKAGKEAAAERKRSEKYSRKAAQVTQRSRRGHE